jgi:hypothetical protein
VSTAPADGARRIARNEAALDRYRAERAERGARGGGSSARASEPVIGRLEAETTLLRGWAERDARASAP